MQVAHIKHKFKAPGTDLLTLKYDYLLSIFAFKFNLRHHNQVAIEIFGVNQPPVPTYKEVATVGRGHGTYFPLRHQRIPNPRFLHNMVSYYCHYRLLETIQKLMLW